ncbi:hypothetical protein IF803_06500 [Bradyrhizobium sp. UFLA06-06]
MTETSGDNDKQANSEENLEHVRYFQDAYELTLSKVALGNLFLQREIEVAKLEHAAFAAVLKAARKKIENVEVHAAPPPKRSSPPVTAAFLLAFIAPKDSAQALLGDLEEMFQKNAERFGDKQATRMYWFEVARSIGPIAWQWVKKMGFITFLVDYLRTKFGF